MNDMYAPDGVATHRERPRNVCPSRTLPVLVVVAFTIVGGCSWRAQAPEPATPPIPVADPVPVLSPWPGTLAAALRAADAGRYDHADSILRAFSVEHAGKSEGTESDFWRALLKADPLNSKVTAREQQALLDVYLTLGPSAPRYAEAMILRRMIDANDSTRSLITTMRERAEQRERLRDEELRRLNELYDRTAAELERIKRRLVPTKP